MFLRDQKFMYGLLMKVAAEALKELCARKRHLGALPGILAVLHTWTGELRFHPHVHLLITGGGITPDGEHFEPALGKFLVPVAVLSRKIAAKFRETLESAWTVSSGISTRTTQCSALNPVARGNHTMYPASR